MCAVGAEAVLLEQYLNECALRHMAINVFAAASPLKFYAKKNETGPMKSTEVRDPNRVLNSSLTFREGEKHKKSSTYSPK